MIDKIQGLIKEISDATAHNREEVEQLRLKFLSKKGLVSVLFDDFRSVPAEKKREVGQLLNELKNHAQQRIDSLKASFEGTNEVRVRVTDLTRPVTLEPGTRHPLSIVRNQIIDIFARIGFTVAVGP